MTSLSRRKRRTTAPRTTRPRTAVSLALLAALAATPAVAQQPPARPALPNYPLAQNRPGLSPPPAGYGYAQPPAANPAPAPAAPAPGNGLPPGYRPVGGTRQDAAPAAPGAGGKVMYFHKPADALAPDNLPADAGGVAMAADSGPAVPPAPPPDVPRRPVLPPAANPPAVPPPVTARPIPPVPQPAPVYAPAQEQPGQLPMTSTSQKKQPTPIKPPDPAWTQLPPRSTIFQMRDDPTLERNVVDQVREEVRKRIQDKDKPPVKIDESAWRFPDLTPFVPPGTQYVPKTASLPPGKTFYEASWVVHRRLHFEEKNAERYGWDFGFVQPFLSAAVFYKDVLLWPNSLASGFRTGFWDTNAGKCLPGSPVPYYFYPQGLTITGTVFEAGVITGLSFIIP